MKLSELFSDNFFTLPKTRPNSESFQSFTISELERFKSKIDLIDDLEGLPFALNEMLNRQNHLITNINNAIDNYLNGKPAIAFDSLKTGLQESEKDFLRLLNVTDINENTDFYRIRYSENNIPFPKNQFFHIPFELRGKVKTQRFSIPGFPSLYLGNSVYVCWEELNRPNISNFQAVRFSNTRKISVIDLSPLDKFDLEEFYNYIMVWPLIFASSIKVSNTNDDFKPEYIIPQMLLQYVRENSQIDGICYQTTHIDFKNSQAEGDFLNYVIPVKTISDTGLCTLLSEMFLSTEANSYQLHNTATEGAPFFTSKTEDMYTAVKKIELVRGRPYNYNISSLCELEGALQAMELSNISCS